MPKRIGKNETAEIAKVLAQSVENDASLVDSGLDIGSFAVEKAVDKDEPTETAKMAEEIRKAEAGNTLLDPGDYDGFSPDIKVQPRTDAGLSSLSTAHTRTIDTSGEESARAATKIDLSKLDESMIMSLPFIKASDNMVPAILFLKPKDPTIRFRWVNFKNWEGGNYQRHRAFGFQNASMEDVDQNVTPVTAECIDGSNIKWYDVILMKINVFQLMSLYKRNMMSSLKMVGRFREQARSMAQKQFDHDIHNGLVGGTGPNKNMQLLTAFKKMKEQGYNVEFYVPGLEEIVEQDKSFLHDSV